MDLDSRGYSKLVKAWNSGRSDEYTRKYTRILEKLFPLPDRHDHDTPEMWCSRICDPFRKILEEHHTSRGGILSGNGYIKMFGKLIERSDRVHRYSTNYIYCNVCDSLVLYLKMVLVELITIEITTLRAVSMKILFQKNIQEEKKFSNLLIEGNLKFGNTNNTYYEKRRKLSVFV